MSRKRGVSSCHRNSLRYGTDFQGNGNELECSYDDCVYYRPGCYCIPQVIQPNLTTPYTCAYVNNDGLMQWPTASEATYVVDACGLVYYLSDFENLLQIPNLPLETEITYHYQNVTESTSDSDEEERESVSPRKRERFEEDSDNSDNYDPNEYQEQKDHNIKSSNCYRTEQGYIVEEPSDEEKEDKNSTITST